jgi:predicted dehydrogenase/threonine dehydrogenase-like Zn-dependent dehydrogenase
MKQLLLRQGQVGIEEVPAPTCAAGGVIIRVEYSCISSGTEIASLEKSAESLWQKAVSHPEQVRAALKVLINQGVGKMSSLIAAKVNAGVPMGYSAAGVVTEVGQRVADLQVGQRVACAGAQCSNHAEWICVPRNLVVPVPESVTSDAASTVALGAIAMQGVRRADPTLGEIFVVLGLGIIGQITAQLLRGNGCRVIGLDPDAHRTELAVSLGMEAAIDALSPDAIEQVRRITDGHGADGVIITAATISSSVVSNAFKMCRKKGRVVLVGDVGLRLNRADLYEKELDFLIATSYGPGRYDEHYERSGLDYPIGYVRWTENRNMREYLRQLEIGGVSTERLITKVYPLDQAPRAYSEIREHKNIMVLLSYAQASEVGERKTVIGVKRPLGAPRIRVAIIGAGAFAKAVHLPNLAALGSRYKIQAVVNASGYKAKQIGSEFSAEYASTDYAEVLADPDVDAVLIATRHNLHGDMVLAALRAGKHVLVEKPLALTASELEQITAFFQASSRSNHPVLLTGFNRRFSPYVTKIAQVIQKRTNPMIIAYLMNAGYIPPEHWVHEGEGGGRNLGEACHIYDLFTCLANSASAVVTAVSILPTTSHYSCRDNFIASMRFGDGSVACLTYTSLGNSSYPKETMQLAFDGKILVLNNYQHLEGHGVGTATLKTRVAEKGHREELTAFADAVEGKTGWPIPLWQQVQATTIALTIEEQLQNSRPQQLRPYGDHTTQLREQ